MLSNKTKLAYYNILNGIKLPAHHTQEPFDVTISDVKLTYKDINLHYIKGKNYFVEAPPKPKFDRGRDRDKKPWDKKDKKPWDKKDKKPWDKKDKKRTRSEERPRDHTWQKPKKIEAHEKILDKKMLHRMQRREKEQSDRQLQHLEKSKERFPTKFETKKFETKESPLIESQPIQTPFKRDWGVKPWQPKP